MLKWLFGSSRTPAADQLIAEGNRAEKEGRMREACELYRKAVATAPRHGKAQLNLGIALQALGEEAAAVAAYEAALAIDAVDAYANYNLGSLLASRGDLARAERLLRAALVRKREFPEALVALANVCEAQGNAGAALAALEEALRWRPDFAGAWYNYGDALLRLNRRAAAETAFRRALESDPACLPALHMLGNMLRADSRIDEALEAFGAARKLDASRFDLESMELHVLNLSDEIGEEALAARHRAFGARLEEAVTPRFAPFRNSREPERRLRIGYVSCDFNQHPVAWFMLPVIEGRDRKAFEVHCYSTGSKADEVTRKIAQRADGWHQAAGWSDTELADSISRDAIDVLVDLTGHAGVMRLGVFAQQPAPVQATWLGYLNTTGLSRIQYRLCDALTDPPGLTERLHTETLIRLPHSQWCYRPVVATRHAVEPPLARNGCITFGSFNHAPKLSPTARRLWCEILTRLPDSRMVVVGMPEGQPRDRLLEDFRQAGVAASRLTVAPRVPLDEYFRWFDEVDIALDSMPYSGGTTTCDTLWMGVPVVTFAGPRSVSRSAASILATAGLGDWIGESAEDYVRLAVESARDPARLAGLRGSLRQRLRESPLMDEAGFVPDLEDAYRRMWRGWCENDARIPGR
jgi:protein O-GlcNAc transferase